MRDPVFCRKSCLLESNLEHLWSPDGLSRMAKGDEEAQCVGNGYFCASVLHLCLVLVEIKGTWASGDFFYYYSPFLIFIFIKNSMSSCCRVPMSLDLWKAASKLYWAVHRRADPLLGSSLTARSSSHQDFTETLCSDSVADVLQGGTKCWYLPEGWGCFKH